MVINTKEVIGIEEVYRLIQKKPYEPYMSSYQKFEIS